tara:strand:- start:101 stop:283 length:183 start_codon:yes stop_codon:yes gene_type:complete
MDANSKVSNINQIALDMLDRIKVIEDRDDRVAVMFEVYEFIFNEVIVDDVLYVPDFEAAV